MAQGAFTIALNLAVVVIVIMHELPIFRGTINAFTAIKLFNMQYTPKILLRHNLVDDDEPGAYHQTTNELVKEFY
ncbi:hypothetical protein T265_11513 [Opisthorchis viverrini]|uniref:Uncharacterized protein n=1 Tax=Opisthorchis viverrini TaxID=6198 RepID=A0A074YYQ7_OPIVI|nr:hypothetical protein T265_11513 [Opisthorchis viverrini]KER19793.1 hypothetical protein T265_11513 [Opisthorchis viverrini]